MNELARIFRAFALLAVLGLAVVIAGTVVDQLKKVAL